MTDGGYENTTGVALCYSEDDINAEVGDAFAGA
jgi:hypothetical protein